MAQPPTLRTLRLEDLGDAASPELESLLGILNAFMGEVTNALQGRLTRGDNILSQGRTGLKFRTPTSGAHVCSVAHGLPQPVKHALVSGLKRTDNVALSSAWSSTFVNTPGAQVQFTFQGLTADTEYSFNVIFE